MKVYTCFPGGKAKALTMSYDDGKVQDRRLIDIFNKYGIKGTFNLNYGLVGERPRMTFEEMKKIVVDTLNCEEDKVTMEASLTEDLEADSLDAVELNMALEDACGVSIPDEELAKLKTVGDIFNYITAHV